MGAGHTRREFLRLASAGAGATAWAMSAASYGRVLGANDRINIGLIGCGSRGKGAHMPGVRNCKDRQNAAVVAVCDPWRLAREEAAQLAKDWFGVENPQQYVSYRDLLAEAEVDAIMIASCDFQHTTHLTAAAKAGKHVYCEKPLSMDVESLNRAYDAVKEAGVVFQAGTQLRSQSSFVGCREVYRTGVLGTVGRVEQQRNGDRPYWYAYIKDAKEEDVDWAEFLMDRPMRPFDPVQFTGWYGYRDFSDGPVPGLASHYVDLVHYITGAGFPVS
ncbi:MAG: Gfo/Idh/MocA family oxidoreductase, partial [Candidatus Hydrogenedentes bacterium]|nr:Gfo/Idh/MocA family oxidoreductase [Candidatus Hydrogenedentota bacterium]